MEFQYQFFKEINSYKLHKEISQVMGDVLSGINQYANNEVIVKTNIPLNSNQISQLTTIVSNHTVIYPEQIINDRLKYFQSVAPQLLIELYVENTMAGISEAQSDQMFDDYNDVLTRIREGAFPTALYRLNQKVPSGFVTQELIDSWKAKIQGYINS